MGGGLLQLVAYGAQDVYLTGNPQITFFKVVYRRHTNFAVEAIQQTFNGNPGYGNTVTCQISRNGDLINRVYLQATLGTITGANYLNYVGLRLLKNVVLEIGGQQIDKHYSDWMYIWNELSLPEGKRHGYDKMVGASPSAGDTLYIPLEFWFCRNVGLALPLIALQYHEVKIKIEFETRAKCATNGATVGDLTDVSLWVDYIFLDTDERRRFAQLSHEYLIEQLQFTGTENLVAGSNRIKLNFNHPCKELVWVAKTSLDDATDYWYNYTTKAAVGENDIGSNPFVDAILQLNGNDRFAVRNGSYFNLVQPYQHHTNIPKNPGINVYSFALKPEDHQPSGTLNMSRIDTATLMVNTQASTSLPASESYTGINIYAVNYNVLRILSGMGGLAYSN
ncbi:hypothetical protein EB151_12030 [archaeon]|nr:hypothetical protein [archaeon]